VGFAITRHQSPEFPHGTMTLLFPLALASPAPNRNTRFPTDLAPHGPAPSSSSTLPELPSRSRNVPFFLRPSFHLPFSHLSHPYPIKTHTSRWLVHGSENRTLPRRRKRSCRRFPVTKVRRKRSKSARLSSVLTSFIAPYLIPHGPNQKDVSLQLPAVVLADATRLCKSIWQAYVAMRVTRASLDGAAAGEPQLAVV
jgi:hypothetical protein